MAGDMFLGALIDLGVPEAVVAGAVGALGLGEVTVETRRARRGGVDGIRFRVLVAGAPLEGPDPGEAADTAPNPEPGPDPGPDLTPDLDVTLDGVLDLLAASPLETPVRGRAERMFGSLAEALARTGGRRPHEVRLTGRPGIDFLADLVGSAAAIAWLAPERITCGPVHVGGPASGARGGGRPPGPSKLTASIGPRRGPASGSLWLLGDAPIATSGGGERLTPTGAVLLAELVDEFTPPPEMDVEARGFGLGRAETLDCPNFVEAVLGVREGPAGRNGPPSAFPSQGGTSA